LWSGILPFYIIDFSRRRRHKGGIATSSHVVDRLYVAMQWVEMLRWLLMGRTSG
jgi:hypothetical protein